MIKNFFLDYFPPPRYLRMPAVGIDVSDRSIKYVEIARKKGNPFIKRFGSHLMPEGIIEAGEIKEKGALIDFLKSIQKELQSNYVISVLPEEKAFLATVRLPLIEKDDIRETLELQLEEHIPLPARETIFDFEIIKKESNHLEVILIAFPQKIVEDYRDCFVAANFIPLALEMEIQASLRVLIPPDDKKMKMLVDFGRTRTTFAVVNGEKIQFTSTIRFNGQDLENAIMKDLQVDKFQAEKIKKENGFLKTKQNEKVFNAILPLISSIKDEMIKYINYCNSHMKNHNNGRISKIILYGGDSNLFGLPEYLSYETKIPVELGNPWVNIYSFDNYIPEIELRESLSYVTAIGLGLRDSLLQDL